MIEKVKTFVRSGRLADIAGFAVAGSCGAFLWALGSLAWSGFEHADSFTKGAALASFAALEVALLAYLAGLCLRKDGE